MPKPKAKRTLKGVPVETLAVARTVRSVGTVVEQENFFRAMYVDWASNPLVTLRKESWKVFARKFNCPLGMAERFSKDPAVQAELRVCVRERFGGGEQIKKLYQALFRKAEEGNVQAVKLAMEVTGEYTPKQIHEHKVTLEDYLDELDRAIDVTP